MRDTVIKPASPATAYGTAKTLSMSSADQGLLMFKTPTTPTGSTVASAQLCLTPTTNASTAVTVYTAPWGWSETTTWNTKPYVEKTSVGSTTGSLAAGRRVCLPVPASFLEVNETEFRIGVGAGVSLASREAGRTGPSLAVTYERLPPRLRLPRRRPRRLRLRRLRLRRLRPRRLRLRRLRPRRLRRRRLRHDGCADVGCAFVGGAGSGGGEGVVEW